MTRARLFDKMITDAAGRITERLVHALVAISLCGKNEWNATHPTLTRAARAPDDPLSHFAQARLA